MADHILKRPERDIATTKERRDRAARTRKQEQQRLQRLEQQRRLIWRDGMERTD